MTRSLLKRYRPTQRRDAFPHPRKSEVAFSLERMELHVRRRPLTVVFHPERDHPILLIEQDCHRPCAGVARHVGQALLKRAEERHLRLVRQRGKRLGGLNLYRKMTALTEIVDQGAHRREQPEIVQQRRPEVV